MHEPETLPAPLPMLGLFVVCQPPKDGEAEDGRIIRFADEVAYTERDVGAWAKALVKFGLYPEGFVGDCPIRLTMRLPNGEEGTLLAGTATFESPLDHPEVRNWVVEFPLVGPGYYSISLHVGNTVAARFSLRVASQASFP